MTRTAWGLLLAVTCINCSAAILTLREAAQARADFRAAAETISQLGATILDAINRVGGNG